MRQSNTIHSPQKEKIVQKIKLNLIQFPGVTQIKQIWIHINKHLIWKHHFAIKAKWLNQDKSTFWLKNINALGYKTINYNRPIRTYGIELLSSDRNSNIDILRRYETKIVSLHIEIPKEIVLDCKIIEP